MRYQNIRAFQKHLASAAPDHLSRCYLAMVPDDYERGSAIRSILSHFAGRPRIALNGDGVLCREIADALLSPSLFGGDPVVVLDGAEKMGKKEIQSLSDLVAASQLYGYLICGTSSKTALAASFEKVGVVLDLSEEKPWEKEKRLAEQMSERAQNGGKRLAPDAIPLLFERIGTDPAILDSEIDKLICFVGTRLTIERSDVFRIASSSRQSTLWQLAEELVWEGRNGSIDSGTFHALVPVLRNQLQIGLKLVELMASNTPKTEWSTYVTKLWPKLLEKRSSQAMQLGRNYFKKGLELLFEIELLSRTQSGREEALLDYFRMALRRPLA